MVSQSFILVIQFIASSVDFVFSPFFVQAFCSQALPDWVLYKFAMDHNLKLRERTMKAEKEKKES